MDKENKLRMQYLENKAKEEFIENSDWSTVMEMLDEEERKELNGLYDDLDSDHENE